ncbi:pro-resilin-like [Eriocheir sinensis]|uniref:pro-resilin-like n=1 Tax=Eriocheir sinensis TaxID=95602 RepID=UPI0021C78235|nr:pro-resilin-like [Eriocheir sinensis]
MWGATVKEGVQNPVYSYEWVVNDHYSGIDFSHSECRDGCDSHGSYHVLLSDGPVEKLTYTVIGGNAGYVNTVEFERETHARPDAGVHAAAGADRECEDPTACPPPRQS